MNIDKLASRNGILIKKDLRVLSLFSGCGGMKRGFKKKTL